MNFSNNDNNSVSEVWLPAWKFVLTRQRNYDLQLTDTDVSYGDIDISKSIALRGIAGATSIDWTTHLVTPNGSRDKVFDLLGSTSSGAVSATAGAVDFLEWQRQYHDDASNPLYEQLSADFNDDGNVNGDDLGSVWQAYFGNTLDLEGINVLSVPTFL